MSGPAGRVWAARYRKVKAQLDRIDAALSKSGLEVDPEDEEGTASAVEQLAAERATFKRQVEDYEFDHPEIVKES